MRRGVSLVSIVVLIACGAAGESSSRPSVTRDRLKSILATFCPAASVQGSKGARKFVSSVVSSLPRVFTHETIGLSAGAALVLAGRGLDKGGVRSARGRGYWVLHPLRACRRAMGRVLACVHSSDEDKAIRARMEFRKTPSVVTWHQPRCLLQVRVCAGLGVCVWCVCVWVYVCVDKYTYIHR